MTPSFLFLEGTGQTHHVAMAIHRIGGEFIRGDIKDLKWRRQFGGPMGVVVRDNIDYLDHRQSYSFTSGSMHAIGKRRSIVSDRESKNRESHRSPRESKPVIHLFLLYAPL